jgi:Flp pilus assembly protein TadG
MDGRRQTFLKSRDGSVILETALMITVLLLLTFGMVDFGRVMYASNSLISAAREGARFGSVEATVNSTVIDSVVRGRFNQYTFGGDTLKNSNIVVTDSSALSPPSVKITITYPFKWISPVARLLGWTNGSNFTTNLHATAQYRYELQ